MPEVHFLIQWPDGEISRCYSPSTVVLEYFEPGLNLTIAELATKSTEALNRASDRVKAKFGYRCTSAEAQLQQILAKTRNFKGDQEVKILSIE